MATNVPQHEVWARYGTPQEVVAALIDEIRGNVESGNQPVASRTILATSFLPGGGTASDEEIIDTVDLLATKMLPKGVRVVVRLVHHVRPVRARFTSGRYRRRAVVVLSTLYIGLKLL